MKPNLKLVIASTLVCYMQNSSAIDYTIEQITNNTYYDSLVNINDKGELVWSEVLGGNHEIMYFDGLDVTQLTNNNYHEQSPVINNSSQITWMRDTDNFEIVLYDDGNITQITNDIGTSFLLDDSFPRIIDDGSIFWKKFGSIYKFDGINNFSIAEQMFGSPSPYANNLGQVVWSGKNDGNQEDVFLFDPIAGLTNITNSPENERYPQINNLGQIVWQTGYSLSTRIFLYENSVIKQLTNNHADGVRINNLGQIVWSSYDGNDTELFLYDSGVIKQITDNSINDFNIQINDKGQIVWSGGDGGNAQVYLYDSGQVHKITNFDYVTWAPVINNNGVIAWVGKDGGDWDVFRAVPPNLPPASDAGIDQVLECLSSEGTLATLNGTRSSDPDMDTLSYLWSAPGVVFDNETSSISSAVFPLGKTVVTLSVSDGIHNSLNTVSITVQDTVPPKMVISHAPSVLTKPNHKLVDITASVYVVDNCDTNPSFVLSSIYSDEEENGKGDGNTSDDIQSAVINTPDTEFKLRAERSGKGEGRIYSINYIASDASDNDITSAVEVTVPH